MSEFDYTGTPEPSPEQYKKLKGEFDYSASVSREAQGGDGPDPERTLLVSVFINE